MESDLILLQETHSCELDTKFWKSQWGNTVYFSHGTNHSAGVLILLHKIKGDILETVPSENGRCITLIIKQDNATFIVCNLYGFNSHVSNKILLNQIILKLKELLNKYQSSTINLCGDFNVLYVRTNQLIDTHPNRILMYKIILSLHYVLAFP